MTPDAVVHCRPPRSHWLLLVFPSIYGLGAAAAAFAPTPQGPPSPGRTLFFLTLSLLCFLGVCVLAWWLLRAGITACGDGLRVRGFGGWRAVRWEEVTDFSEKLPTGKRSAASSYVLETAPQKICFSGDWSNAAALVELVSQKAVHSRVSEWAVKGTRSVDPWPAVFDYDTRENRWAPRIWLKLFGVFVVYLIIQPALQFAATANLIGWTAAFVSAVLYLALIGSVGLVFLLPLAQYRAASKRKAERIAADLNGITFEDGTRRVEAAWPEVTGYRVASSHAGLFEYVVETQQGDFDFLPSLGQARLLRAIIQHRAVNASAREWRRTAEEEALGGEAGRWTGREVGVGVRFFHYRTRGYRAVLLGAAFLGVVCGLLFTSIGLGWLPGNALPASGAPAAGIGWGAALLLGWRAYLRNGIAADETGLTQRTLFGARRLAWEQVQQWAATPTQGGKVCGRGMTLRFSREIVGYEELTAEIARHAGVIHTPVCEASAEN